jgi:nucleoside-diphosphate-sugar epimerase
VAGADDVGDSGAAAQGCRFVLDQSRELAETAYQFQHPFVLDSSRSEQLLGQRPSPLAQAAADTVQWWRRRS